MNNDNHTPAEKQLTAEESQKLPYSIFEQIESYQHHSGIVFCHINHVANFTLQQTAALQERVKELERQLKASETACEKWCNRWAEKNQITIDQKSRIAELEKEVKKADDHAKIQADASAELMEDKRKSQQHAEKLMGLLEKEVKWTASERWSKGLTNEDHDKYLEAHWQSYCKEHNITQNKEATD